MSKTISLLQSVMQDIVSLMNDNAAMKKLQTFLKDLKKEKKKEADTISKEEVLYDLKEAFDELKLVKEGEISSRPVKELLNEL